MFYKYKNIDEIIAKLNGYLDETTAKREAWAAVAVLKRKDGKEYERIGQAVKGAAFGKYHIVEDAAHPYLTICAKTAAGRYITDSIPAYYYVDELPADDPRRADDVKSFLRRTTPQTPDELRQSITAAVARYSEQIEEYKKQIAAAPVAYKNYREAIQKAENSLYNDSACKSAIHKTSLYYLISETN